MPSPSPATDGMQDGRSIIQRMEPDHTGVLIIGGGLVGTSVALALDRAGVDCTLVETRTPTLALADPDRERYLALSAATVNGLDALGVWTALRGNAAPITGVHISRRGGFGRTLLRAADHGVQRFGALVPATRLGLALETAVAQAGGVHRILPAQVTGVDMAGGDALVTVREGDRQRVLRAGIVVGADGADSWLRGQLGLPVERGDYGQDALVLSAATTRAHEGVAYERFLDDGAIAVLPLEGRRVALVWTLSREQAARIEALDDGARLAEFQRAFGHRLGRLQAPGRLFRYPLHRVFAPRTVAGRAVLVGNAAQSLHPIAAQGFNLGFRDALVLVEELLAARRAGEDAGTALLRHQARRQPDRRRIAGLSHALARWPSVRAPGMGVLRSLGFGVLNGSAGLRSSLVLATMGHGARSPLDSLHEAAA